MGEPAAGHHLFHVVGGAESASGPCGSGRRSTATTPSATCINIEIDEGQRGRRARARGHARGGGWTAAQGARRLSLNVFGFNDVARSLYDSLGYVVAATNMYRDL